MEPQEKAQYYMELIKVVLQRWQGTQKNQWTFNAIFWTGILLTAPYLRGIKYVPDWTFVIFAACVTGGYAVIIYLIQKTLDWDKEKFKAYRKQLEDIIGYNDKQDVSKPYFISWLAAQVFMTFMLLAGIFIFLLI